MVNSLDARAKGIIDGLIESSDEIDSAAVERACGGDGELAARVHELLGAIHRQDEFLSNPTVDDRGGAEQPGTTVGRYKLLERLGEGGFGSVWAAEQREPVQRRVALKIIKLGMDTGQVIARFEAERQALALMDHPNIARILDAGSTEAGRPFFVMELVRGVPILEYCDTAKLDTRSRLDLFAKVCHAIQHAHQKGIIHRDVKPGNVLVTMHDGVPVPKVIDFGIAKATNAELTAKTIYTQHRQMIGTPAYMSPEQAEMSGLDIDTRSDIYSLGVLLYELLTGTTPFANEELMRKGFAEMMRIIREVEPLRPSTRLSSLGDTATQAAQQRGTDARKLSGILKGDLDWIVMKCLEKDRARRYEAASALAADVLRHLGHEPVTAGPPSVSYRLHKFVKRHRPQAIAGAVAAAAMLLGMIGTGLALRRALRAESSLRGQLAETTRAHEAERSRADELKRVSDFQEAMLTNLDPTAVGVKLTDDVRRRLVAALEKSDVPEGERAGLVEGFSAQWARVNATDTALALIDEAILKPAVKAVDQQFADQPIVDAQLRQGLSRRYRELGLYDAAHPLQIQSLATRRRVLGQEDPSTVGSIIDTGLLLQAEGKPAEAEPYYREALEKSRRLRGEDHPDTIDCIGNMGSVLRAQGKLAEAVPFYREALEKRRRVNGEDHPDTLKVINNMAVLLRDQGKAGQAEPFAREALDKSRRILGEDNPGTLRAIHIMGAVLESQGKIDQAVPYIREALEKRRRVLGEDHPDTLRSMNYLGSLLRAEGKLDQAELYLREAYEKRRRVLGENHPETLTSITNLGCLLQDRGKLAEAERYFRETLEKSRRLLGEEHPETLVAINNVGSVLQYQGKLAEASRYYRDALEKGRRVLGEEHWVTLAALNNLSVACREQGQYAEAELLGKKMLEIRERTRGPEHPDTLAAITNLGLVYSKMQRDVDAATLFEMNLPAQRRVLGTRHPLTQLAMQYLALAYVHLGRREDAVPLYREFLEVQTAAADKPDAGADVLSSAAWALLTDDFKELGDPARALGYARRACDMEEASHGRQLCDYLDTLALAQHATGDDVAALATQRRAVALMPADSPNRSNYEKRLAGYEAAVANPRNP